MFLWHFPWGRPPWPLASTLPCGARTFLPPCCHGRRPSDLLWRVLQYSAAARCKRRARRPSDYEATVLQARATTSSAHSERVSQSPRSAYANPPRANTAKTVAVQRVKLSARGGGEDFGQQTERRQRHGGGGGQHDGAEGSAGEAG